MALDRRARPCPLPRHAPRRAATHAARHAGLPAPRRRAGTARAARLKVARTAPASWAARHEQLAELARRQIFFVGGAPRSGTTWLQLLLDSHPEISCRGEGLFSHHLSGALDRLVGNWRQGVEAKNKTVFASMPGYPLPEGADADILLGTAVLLALHRQSTERDVRALGEKTPENVFLFPRLKRLFPGAKFIGIVLALFLRADVGRGRGGGQAGAGSQGAALDAERRSRTARLATRIRHRLHDHHL